MAASHANSAIMTLTQGDAHFLQHCVNCKAVLTEMIYCINLHVHGAEY
jgi:hypothetical protein